MKDSATSIHWKPPVSGGLVSGAALIGVIVCFLVADISFGDVPHENSITGAGYEKPREFFTTFGERAVELWHGDMLLEKSMWPDLPPPLEINHTFDAPLRVWQVEGGCLAAFDGGEFGGGLFFATRGSRKWRRVLDKHILSMTWIGERSYVAAGGLAHLDFPSGWVYLVSQDMSGRWSAKQVFSSNRDIPKIYAETFGTEPWIKGERLVIFRLHPFIGRGLSPEDPEDLRVGDVRTPDDMLFGVNRAGVISFLGHIDEYVLEEKELIEPTHETRTNETAPPANRRSAPSQPTEVAPPAKPSSAP